MQAQQQAQRAAPSPNSTLSAKYLTGVISSDQEQEILRDNNAVRWYVRCGCY